MPLTVSNFLLFAIVIGLLYTSFLLWQTYIKSPLSSIPNAGFLAPVSRLLWAFPFEHRGRITIDLPLLHEKHGPLIRIGPNELSFYSMDVYRTVNSIQTPFTKDPRVYGQFVQDEHPGLFSITDPYAHSQRRRLMGQLFNRSKMGLMGNMMTEKVSTFIMTLHQYDSQPVSLVQACRALEVDIVSAFGFGKEIGAICAWTDGEEIDMVKANDEKSKYIAFLSNIPTIAEAFSRIDCLVFSLTGYETKSSSALKKFDLWSDSQLQRLLYNSKSSVPQAHPNFISTMIRSNLSPYSALAEAKEMLGPGTDTTSATLAHILWALAHDHDFQTALAADLAAAAWPTDMTALEGVPRLRAAVKEGIRWAGAAAAMLPRVVPPDGVVLAGTFVPGGTVISSSPIWYLHNKDAFPDPKMYRPARWLDNDDLTASALRDRFYIPFSTGSAACIGAHFAYLELYLSVSLILKSFYLGLPRTGLHPPSTEASLPERLEWVAAVPIVPLEVCFRAKELGNLFQNNHSGSGIR
ncbi:benzoate 4-monooxygenase cytochrome p450 [Halenospora varia]|nr:benzoate 4-monooxygenase cytochrome p450 [Halenospora varia]